MRRRLKCSLICLTLAIAGCSSESTLTGKVSYKGRTVISGSVIALSADGSARSGVIYPDGTYIVKGVPRGTVRLGVFSPDPAHARSILTSDDNRSKSTPKSGKKPTLAANASDKNWFPLPRELGDPQKSGLSCEVGASHVEHNIDIAS